MRTLKIEKILKEEQGEFKSVFHYKASKETGLSEGDTYIEIQFYHEKAFEIEKEVLHKHKTPLMYDNREFWTDERLKYVEPITMQEYIENIK